MVHIAIKIHLQLMFWEFQVQTGKMALTEKMVSDFLQNT